MTTGKQRFREENDLLGSRKVPAEAYWGIQTLRAMEIFAVSRVPLHNYSTLITAIAMVKKACALANKDLGHLKKKYAKVIIKACDEIITGALHDQFIVDMMNEDLEPINIIKTLDDVALSTVDISVLDVEELLTDLAEIVGLTPDDVDILRRDLDKMRPSERAGFIYEVLKQERARRAREIAEARLEPEVPEAMIELERKLTEEELEHLRERLIGLGISDTEADLMVEQARTLSKAEIDALLEEIGGEEE